jgi:dynein heavy chain, axonemal
MEAICIMFEVKPKKVSDPNNLGKKLDDYWEPTKNVIQKS